MFISAMISTDKSSIYALVYIVTLAGSYKITVSLNTRAMNFKLSGKTASGNKQKRYLCTAYHRQKYTLQYRPNRWYTAFGMWWHTVTHGRGSEGETGEWSE